MKQDLFGEKTALDNTRIILKQIEPGTMSLKMRNKLAHYVLDKQLKKFTNYRRLERRKVIRNMLKSPSPHKMRTNGQKNSLTPVIDTPPSRAGHNGHSLQKNSKQNSMSEGKD